MKEVFTTVMWNNQRKMAFTLAEVLITLGIIGVVAALTMPALIGNYRKVQTVTKLKKAYSSLQQSVQMSQFKYGDIANWDWTLDAEEFFKFYLSSNLSVIKFCSNGDNTCWSEDGAFMLSGGKYYDSPLTNGWIKMILSDGTFIALQKQDNNHIHLNLDLNGSVRPNTLGIDIFVMTLTSNSLKDSIHNISNAGLFMYGHGLTENELKSAGCSKSSTGLMCGEKILMDGWDIKDDYPWK